jgi:hypothetical protein
MRHDLGWLQCTSSEDGPVVALQEWPCTECGGEKLVLHIIGISKLGALLACNGTMAELDVNPAADASLTAPAPVLRPEHAEGDLARLIEQQTAKIPSHWFLLGALGAMGLSLVLEVAGRQRQSRFVGQWPAPLLIMGMYNKLVKTMGTR